MLNISTCHYKGPIMQPLSIDLPWFLPPVGFRVNYVNNNVIKLQGACHL